MSVQTIQLTSNEVDELFKDRNIPLNKSVKIQLTDAEIDKILKEKNIDLIPPGAKKAMHDNKSSNFKPNKVYYIQNSEEFVNLIKRSEKIVFLYGSDNCPPCIELKPWFERLANRNSNKCVFAYIDVDKNNNPISSTPTIRGYVKGKKIDEKIGLSKRDLKEFITKIIKY